jgi:hypothetical protein
LRDPVAARGQVRREDGEQGARQSRGDDGNSLGKCYCDYT